MELSRAFRFPRLKPPSLEIEWKWNQESPIQNEPCIYACPKKYKCTFTIDVCLCCIQLYTYLSNPLPTKKVAIYKHFNLKKWHHRTIKNTWIFFRTATYFSCAEKIPPKEFNCKPPHFIRFPPQVLHMWNPCKLKQLQLSIRSPARLLSKSLECPGSLQMFCHLHHIVYSLKGTSKLKFPDFVVLGISLTPRMSQQLQVISFKSQNPQPNRQRLLLYR